MEMLSRVLSLTEELGESVTLTDINEKEIPATLSLGDPMYPYGRCLVIRLADNVTGSQVKTLVVNVWNFPENIDEIDLHFRDPVNNVMFTVSPFGSKGKSVETQRSKV
jgi:hypothetical protein